MTVGKDKERTPKRYQLIIALFLVSLASLFTFRLVLLEAIGEKVLQSYGFEEANLVVTDVGLNEIQISQIVLDDKFIAENLSAGYSFPSLIRGTVDWVSLSGLIVDVSTPNAGAVGTLTKLVNRQKGTTIDAGQSPSIKLANGSIFGNYPTRNFKSKITLSVSPSGNMKGEASFEGETGHEAGQIKAEGVVLSFEAAIPNKTANVNLKNGVLRHANSQPLWAPTTISGSASFKDEVLEFLLGAGLGEEIPLMRVEGHYSPVSDVGELVLDIQDVAFSREGMQPSDLSGHLDKIPKLDAILSDHSLITWNKGEIVSESEIDLKEMSFEHKDIFFQIPNTKLNLNAAFNLKTAKQRANLVIHDLIATLSMNNKKYALNNVKAELNVNDFGNAIKLTNASASLRHLSDEPNFRSLLMQVKGELKENDFVFEGDVTDIDERLKLPFDGRYKGDDKSAFIRGQLHHKKFERGGFQPKHFSRYFDGLEDEVTGSTVLAGILAWHPDEGLNIPYLSANLTKFGYLGKEIQIEEGQLQAKAQNVMVGQPLKVVFSNGTAILKADERRAKVTDVSAELLIAKDLQSADFSLLKAKLKSELGFLIKPEVEVSGSSTINKKSLIFKGQAKTDLLGSFLDWGGHHDFGPNSGSASMKFAELEFEEKGLQPSDIINELDENFVFTGGLVPELNFEWGHSGLQRSGKVLFRELGVKTDDFDLVGVTGEIAVDELQPLMISTPQEVVATRLSSAVSMDRPTLVFRIASKDGKPILLVDRLAIDFAGGQALVEEAVLDAQSSRNQLKVQFSNLDLEKVMAFTEVEAVTASGILNGFVPIVFENDNVFVELGILETEGPGILQLKSERARHALAGGGEQTKLLFDILENFQYSELEIQIKKQASGEDTVALHTKGANPDVEDSRPVILNINLSTNLDRIFSTLLDGYRLSEKALRATVNNRRN